MVTLIGQFPGVDRVEAGTASYRWLVKHATDAAEGAEVISGCPLVRSNKLAQEQIRLLDAKLRVLASVEVSQLETGSQEQR